MKTKHYLQSLSLILVLTTFAAAKSALSSSDMARAQKGKILLQVESHGEAWYINPKDEMRYYLGRPEDAFSLMRQLGLGIKNSDLNKIRIAVKENSGSDSDGDGLSDMLEDAIGTDKARLDTDGDSYNDSDEIKNGYNPNGAGRSQSDTSFVNMQKGKIFLQVESHGEAWYVNPADGLRYFMGRPADAFNLMRSLGLGISNSNLNKIAVKSGNEDNSSNNSETVNDELGGVIKIHLNQLTEFIAVYDSTEYEKYNQLADSLFTDSSKNEAKEKVGEFFTDFVSSGLKKVARLDLNEEYSYAAENEDLIPPYEKKDDSTIIIGLGVETAIPYELKFEDGNWKIDLDFSKKYYEDTDKIAEIESEAEGSEVELYIIDKIESALKTYKKSNDKYPKYLREILSIYPALKDDYEYYYYAVEKDNFSACHFATEINDDDKKLASDKDFNSLDVDYFNGFNGEDPIYDLTLD